KRGLLGQQQIERSDHRFWSPPKLRSQIAFVHDHISNWVSLVDGSSVNRNSVCKYPEFFLPISSPRRFFDSWDSNAHTLKAAMPTAEARASSHQRGEIDETMFFIECIRRGPKSSEYERREYQGIQSWWCRLRDLCACWSGIPNPQAVIAGFR